MDEQFDIRLSPGRMQTEYFRDMWRYRELLWFLTWRNILVVYKQTVIGVLWSVLRPLLMLVVFTIVFGYLARVPNVSEAPYALVVFCGLVPWYFFSGAVSQSSNSLIDDSGLISKVYFPRILVPISAMLAAGVDFLITLVLLVGLMIVLGYPPTMQALAAPGLIVFLMIVLLGVGLLMAALNVQYRDFRYIIGFLLQVGIFASPVIYSSQLVPEAYRIYYFINPIAGVIDGFRWAFVGQPLFVEGFVLSLAVGLCLPVIAIAYFRHVERFMADVI